MPTLPTNSVLIWDYFPRFAQLPEGLRAIVTVFEESYMQISSVRHTLNSNAVLSVVAGGLRAAGWQVEGGKKKEDRIHVPVLFGPNGRVEKAFDADAAYWDATMGRFVLEVEAGRGVTNHQFLKDFFEACMMQDVLFCAIAVRQLYAGNNDYKTVVTFFETLYASRRLELPLKGILVVGY